MTARRHAVILPVVLMIVLLVGLLGGMFAFRVNADLAATRSAAYRMQTRLAALAGVEYVKLMLRESRLDVDRWYHNPDELNRVLVWAQGTNPTDWATATEFSEPIMAYRFSIVADDPLDDEEFARFGVTDEASKLNLNTATEEQLRSLVEQVITDPEVDPGEIVNAILDWRDPDQTPSGREGDTEGIYYRKLPKPYLPRNAPFESVEELLLVKGITGRILYGEDQDRNGLLTPNEQDGDRSFPPDDEDDRLNRGLFPYLTVLSYENNTSNDNRPRGYLFGDQEALRVELELAFPDETALVDYVLAAAKQEGAQGRSGAGNADNAEGGRKGRNNRINAATVGGGAPVGAGNTDAGDGEGSSDGKTAGGGDPDDGGGDLEGRKRDTESNDASGKAQPIRSPASLLLDRTVLGQVQMSPLTPENLPVLLDRLTIVPPSQKRIEGLINVNTAPAVVLRTLAGLTDEQVIELVEMRDRLTSEEKETAAWLVTTGILDIEQFDKIAPLITARAQQFAVEALGYGDHVGMVTRLRVVLDMVGPIAQVIDFRDLSQLGGRFPIREEDLERIRVR